MTHDELMIQLFWGLKEEDYIYKDKALRAVVELHTPFMGNTLELCKECSQARKVDDPVITYPCRTIQAIEKTLGV
jgi:hypothetical protein